MGGVTQILLLLLFYEIPAEIIIYTVVGCCRCQHRTFMQAQNEEKKAEDRKGRRKHDTFDFSAQFYVRSYT
jgi:hypothetical protein